MDRIYYETDLNDFISKYIVTENIFLLLSKTFWSRINSSYNILFLNLKQKRTQNY